MPAPDPPSSDAATPPPATWANKSRGGIRRVFNAVAYSCAGLRAALQHEAAFRQELWVGVPLLVTVPFIAPGRWQGLLMALVIVAVWVAELLNSAIEALADSISVEPHPLMKRAKDMGSAAVMLTLLAAVATWAVLLWP